MIVYREDVERVLPIIEKEFGVKLDIVGGLKKRGYSKHDIDILVENEIEIPLELVEEEWGIWVFKFWKADTYEVLDLGIKIANRLRQLLNLPENFRIDVFFKIPKELKEKAKEHSIILHEEPELEILDYNQLEKLRYFIVTTGGGWLWCFGYI